MAHKPTPQLNENALLSAPMSDKASEAQQNAGSTERPDHGSTIAEALGSALEAQPGRQSKSKADVDLSDISVAEQASILASIQRRAATSGTAALSSKASGKRSRQGNDALQGQEAQSTMQQPGLKQRRISDMFKRVQQTEGGLAPAQEPHVDMNRARAYRPSLTCLRHVLCFVPSSLLSVLLLRFAT